MSSDLLSYYNAIERASEEMLAAALDGDWDQVVKIEGACVLLISQLQQETTKRPLTPEETQVKRHIMQRILLNDAKVRTLAEPWQHGTDDPEDLPRTLH